MKGHEFRNPKARRRLEKKQRRKQKQTIGQSKGSKDVKSSLRKIANKKKDQSGRKKTDPLTFNLGDILKDVLNELP